MVSAASQGGVVMASGLGRRFGGNKLLALFRGKPLIQWALDITEGLFSRRVVVTRSREVAELCRRQEVPVVFHSLPFRSDTVRLGLEALGELPGCLFCPADQPLLSRETVEALAWHAAREPEWIWRTAWQGKAGAPVLFPRWAFPELRSLPEGKGGGAVAARYPERVRLIPVSGPWELADVDRPEDLRRLEEWGRPEAGRQPEGTATPGDVPGSSL